MTYREESGKITQSRLERVFPKQDTTAESFFSQGHTDSRVECRKPHVRLATSVALLIELKAQFYKLVTINQCLAAYTCEMVNKSRIVIFAIIDSDPIVIRHAPGGGVWNVPVRKMSEYCECKWYAAKGSIPLFICILALEAAKNRLQKWEREHE